MDIANVHGVAARRRTTDSVEAVVKGQAVDVLLSNMGVSKNRGTPKWMVYNGKPESPIKIHDLGGPPVFFETAIC